MRHFRNFMMLIMTVSVLTFTSCSKDDDGGVDPGQITSGVLSAKIDGVDFQSLDISSSATLANTPQGQSLVIIASHSDGRAFSFTIFDFTGVGTYNFDGSSPTAGSHVASYSETDVNLSNPMNSTTELWQAPYEDTMAGSISISEETDTKVKGTFELSCKNVGGDNSVKIITDGAFELTKQVL